MLSMTVVVMMLQYASSLICTGQLSAVEAARIDAIRSQGLTVVLVMPPLMYVIGIFE